MWKRFIVKFLESWTHFKCRTVLKNTMTLLWHRTVMGQSFECGRAWNGTNDTRFEMLQMKRNQLWDLGPLAGTVTATVPPCPLWTTLLPRTPVTFSGRSQTSMSVDALLFRRCAQKTSTKGKWQKQVSWALDWSIPVSLASVFCGVKNRLVSRGMFQTCNAFQIFMGRLLCTWCHDLILSPRNSFEAAFVWEILKMSKWEKRLLALAS